jgi:uncharacterized protein YdhG (YjbR/CyaY superfamily)
MKNSKAKTIDDYINELPENQLVALAELWIVIKKIIPSAEECIHYQIPTFKYKGKPLVGFGAFKKHCSFFVMSNTLLDSMKDDLIGLDFKGSTIHFSKDKPLSEELIEKIIKKRIEMIG